MNRRDAMKVMAAGTLAIVASPLQAEPAGQKIYNVCVIPFPPLKEEKCLLITAHRPGMKVNFKENTVKVTWNENLTYEGPCDGAYRFSSHDKDGVVVEGQVMKYEEAYRFIADAIKKGLIA